MADDKKAAPAADKKAAPAARDRFFLCDADCYRAELGGYFKRGDIITVPASKAAELDAKRNELSGKPVLWISQTWTEVDDKGEKLPGGQQAKRIHRTIVTAGKKDPSKTLLEQPDDEE